MHIIRENNARRKIENVLFDRFWYQNREEKQRRERMQKQRVVEENLRKSKEADQRHMEAQEASDFLKSPLGARLKHAMLKIVRRKILEEKDKKLRSDMVRMIDHPTKQDHTVGTLTADNDGTFSPDLEQKIKEELEDRDSISSAVFENMMRNDTIRKDVLRELQHAAQLTPGEEGANTPEDDFNGTQYSGNTFIYREGHSALSSTVLARNDAKIPS